MILIIRLLLYMGRWQLSTLTLAPVVAWFIWREKRKKDPAAKFDLFGDKLSWKAAFWGNIIGSLIFFGVDYLIFKN
jgi:hypothetical protein